MKIAPWRVTLVLLLGVGIVLAIHAALVWLRMRFGYDYMHGVAPLFELDRSPNVPSWTIALLYAAAAGVSCLSAITADEGERRQKIYWFIIVAVMLLLSANTMTSLHEVAAAVANGVAPFDTSIWLMVHAVAGVFVVAAFTPFLARLPLATTVLLIASGAMLLGALGLEAYRSRMVEAIANTPFHDLSDVQWADVRKHWPYIIEVALQKSLEMGALILYIHAVLGYLSRAGARARFVFELAPVEQTPISDRLRPRSP